MASTAVRFCPGRDARRFALPRLGPHAALCAVVFALAPGEAQAQGDRFEFLFDSDMVGYVLTCGIALFAAVVAITYINERGGWRRREDALTADLAEVRARFDRAQIFLHSEPQILICWDAPDSEAQIEGSTLKIADGQPLRRVLAFGSWLTPDCATELGRKVERLRRKGEAFHISVVGNTGRHFDADGRAVGGSAVLRVREVSGDRLELIRLREQHAESLAEISGMRSLFEALPAPVWMRDAAARLVYVNGAYARAVEARDAGDAVARQLELLDQPARAAAADRRAAGAVWRDRVTAIVAGARHPLDVVDAPCAGGSAAMAIDRAEITEVCADLEQQMQSHVRTLDQLPTAVAIFDLGRRLIYHNPAFSALWRLDPAFLAGRPTDGEILDRLRAEQKLPEETDYKVWKARLLEAHRSPEPQYHVWHMPNGIILNVVAHPNPRGGLTWLYDDATKAYDLETRFNALDRMQSETLDTLREGVVVFGADGRLRFANPAFAGLWRLSPDKLGERPRFETIEEACRGLYNDDAAWRQLRDFVTGLDEMRAGFTERIERSDGVTLDCTALPLPEGAALITFVDVTADVNVERALTDRNKALLAAERLRNDFIHHVSYELRSPLNNIAGFVHLLGEDKTGPLNATQNEYLGYVRKSSAALLAIIDDILDLATIDENAMELEIEDVDVKATMYAAIEGVQDRLAENDIDLQIVATDDVGVFRGDAKRVRQILFNLLSNAIGFSRQGQTVTLAAMRRDGEVVLKVTDRGRGIPPEVLERVFDRFESHTSGSRHRGVGLGLSIVRAFMELHGGRVVIDSAPGEGTTVTCFFPVASPAIMPAPLATESVK